MPRYPSDYDREPTPLEMLRQEWQDDHAAQQEQIDEASKLFAKFIEWQTRYEGRVKGYEADEELSDLLEEAQEYLDQNPLPKRK